MTQSKQIIFIHPQAAPKPMEGDPCNGCGVCCLSEPCPLGAVLSRRRKGECVAIRWVVGAALYRCGALSQPREVLFGTLPDPLRPLIPMLAPALGYLATRWIGLGVGCDCSLTLESGGNQTGHKIIDNGCENSNSY